MATSQAFKDYVVRYRKGDAIYRTGDPGTEMYIVQSGSVDIFTGEGAARRSLSVMEKGDFFGEMALIESVPHSSSAEALTDCELIEINSTLFDRMIKGNIEIAVRMLRKLSIRLRDATRMIEDLSAQRALPVTGMPQAIAAAGPATEDLRLPGPGPAVAAAPPAPTKHGVRAQRPPACHAVLEGEDGSELFHLVSPRAAIGRFDPVTGLKPEVDLSALDLNRSVSRHHARLTREGEAYALTEELGALNGTFVNGRKLVSGKPLPIKDGDVLNLGMVKLIFRRVAG